MRLKARCQDQAVRRQVWGGIVAGWVCGGLPVPRAPGGGRRGGEGVAGPGAVSLRAGGRQGTSIGPGGATCGASRRLLPVGARCSGATMAPALEPHWEGAPGGLRGRRGAGHVGTKMVRWSPPGRARDATKMVSAGTLAIGGALGLGTSTPRWVDGARPSGPAMQPRWFPQERLRLDERARPVIVRRGGSRGHRLAVSFF